MNNCSPPFTLGKYTYQVQTNNTATLNALSCLLPMKEKKTSTSIINLDDADPSLSDKPEAALMHVINSALADHKDCIWLDGTCLISTSGQKILLAGASCSGKTTLGLAAVLKHNWKIISEDICLIDPGNRQIVPFFRPLSLRADAAERIYKAIGTMPNLVDNQWLFDPNMYTNKDGQLACILALEPLTGHSDSCLSAGKISINQLLHRLLKHSSCLRMQGGVDVLNEVIKDANCLLVEGGQLEDRLSMLETV